MAAYVSNIVIDVGSDFNQTFYLETSLNAPLNLTGYTATSKMKKHPSSSSTAASFTVSFPGPTNGSLALSLGSTITSGLKFKNSLSKNGTRPSIPQAAKLLLARKQSYMCSLLNLRTVSSWNSLAFGAL